MTAQNKCVLSLTASTHRIGRQIEKGGQMSTNIYEEKRRALSPRETERTLGISHATLYKIIKAGQLKPVKLGSRTVIPVDQINALLDASA
jgi:predicted DNA-binding transcriptional regulator AlpA